MEAALWISEWTYGDILDVFILDAIIQKKLPYSPISMRAQTVSRYCQMSSRGKSYPLRTIKVDNSIVKAMVFPVVLYEYESGTIKKTDYWRVMLLKCGVGGDLSESLGLQGDQTSQS